MALITTAEAWNEKRILHGVRAVKVSVDSTMTDIEVAALIQTACYLVMGDPLHESEFLCHSQLPKGRSSVSQEPPP